MDDIRFKRTNTHTVEVYEHNILKLQNKISDITTEIEQLKTTFCDITTEYFLNNKIIKESHYDRQNGKSYKLVVQLYKNIEAYCVAYPNDDNLGKTFNIAITLLEDTLNDNIPDWYYENTKYIKYGFETFELAKEEALCQLEFICIAIDLYNKQD